ncbi:MAG: universal stress protein [Candidatus Sulfotelmatobacter sp.]
MATAAQAGPNYQEVAAEAIVSFVEEQTRLSIKNILLATVFTEPSEVILSYAVGFARRYHSRMSLTGAASPGAICEIIRKWEIDFVVIGTNTCESRKSNLDTAVGEMLRTVPCPMLVIGPRVTQMGLANGKIERLVYVTNFTASSLEGVSYALALARDHDAELKFVHVAEESPMRPFHFGNSRIAAFRKQLESLVASENGLLQESEFVVQEGDRAEGLVRIAANLDANLIVMSARAIPGKISPYVFWPIAGQVVCCAHCPVLTVRGFPSEEWWTGVP